MMNTTNARSAAPETSEALGMDNPIVPFAGGAAFGALIAGGVAVARLIGSRQRRAAAQAAKIREQIYDLADVARTAAEEAMPEPKPAPVPYPDERLGNFVRGLVLGVVTAGVAVLFNTRQSGAEVRQQLLARLDAARAQALATVDEARRAVEDAAAWASDDELDWSAATTDTSTLVPPAAIPPAPPPPPAAGPAAESPTQPLPPMRGEP